MVVGSNHQQPHSPNLMAGGQQWLEISRESQSLSYLGQVRHLGGQFSLSLSPSGPSQSMIMNIK